MAATRDTRRQRLSYLASVQYFLVFAIGVNLVATSVLWYLEVGRQDRSPSSIENLVVSNGALGNRTVADRVSSNGDRPLTSAWLDSFQNSSDEPPSVASLYSPPDLSGLPEWVLNYFEWHKEMRLKYPGRRLFTHENAPKVLIKYCMQGRCGGTYDRLGTLPLYIANQTNRVLLIKWFSPMKLEEFLEPNLIDWTVPASRLVNTRTIFKRHLHYLKSWYIKGRHRYLNPLTRLREDPIFSKEKIITIRYTGERWYNFSQEAEMRALGETDMLDDTESFGKIWHALFRPSPPVQAKIDETMQQLGLIPGHYAATHCRVRHPGRFEGKEVTGKFNSTEADISGLPFEGKNKEMAIQTAVHALQCTKQLTNEDEPVYFFSDSEDLVNYMVNTSTLSTHSVSDSSSNTSNLTKLEQLVDSVKRSTTIRSRNVSNWPSVHLDLGRHYGAQKEDYYATFVDLYIAIAARCVSFGVGNFAYLAAKISHTSCLQIHEHFDAAKAFNQQTGHAVECTI